MDISCTIFVLELKAGSPLPIISKLQCVYIIMTMIGILLPIIPAVIPLAHQGYSLSGKVPPPFRNTVQFMQ